MGKMSELILAVEKGGPMLAKVLAGDYAGVAMSLLSAVFGTDSKDTDGLLAKISSDPEAELKIKTLEYQHADNLASIAAQKSHDATLDVEDARRYSSQYKDYLKNMSYFVTAGLFVTLFFMFFAGNMNASESQILSMIIGVLVSKWQTIIDFFYGASNK